MENKDIRWHQRFNSLKKAFALLEKAVLMKKQSDIEQEGMIQRFEYTYELSWNTLKDLLEDQGYTDLKGPKDVIQLAFKIGIIEDGEAWMKMFKNRNLTSHTYNEETAKNISKLIKKDYFLLLKGLIDYLEQQRSGKQRRLFDKK